MPLLEWLTGATPEKQEHKGDCLFAAGRWGEAKLEYESALEKLKRRSRKETGPQKQLAAKIRQAREALAREHRQSAADLMDGGYREEAQEMLALAIEVSADEAFQQALEQQVRELQARRFQTTAPESPELLDGPEDDPAERLSEGSHDDYYMALCHTLPNHVRRAYQGYGDNFKFGYMALNRGDFETAAPLLDRAHQTNPQPDSYIPLELATAYLNLDRKSEAHDLLAGFIGHHPETLPAYQLLCEIYWDQKDFEQATSLLEALPPDLSASLAAAVLRGETLNRSGQHEAARDHYRGFIDTYGWNITAAHKLARIYRDLDATHDARKLYEEIMNSCRGCGTRIDAHIKHEYAELCFAEGQHDSTLLEMYLALAREIPEYAALYYERLAHIYARQGNDHEARRFRAFARQTGASGMDNR
ncbi:MAG: tetratricopeptide repeat protein [Desulfosarcina sp.]|nr:tetratricopeptide repeat protein [Desulfobacterales bacterium]